MTIGAPDWQLVRSLRTARQEQGRVRWIRRLSQRCASTQPHARGQYDRHRTTSLYVGSSAAANRQRSLLY